MASNLLATNCQPTHGFHSKGAAIIAMHDGDGLSFGQIGLKLGMKDTSVSSMYVKSKQRAERAVRTIEVNANMYYDLEREAKARGTSPRDLAKLLLEAVVHDKLYAAVLG